MYNWKYLCPCLALCVVAPCVIAQDTTHAHADTTRRDTTTRLQTVTIVATPVQRAEPFSAARVNQIDLQLTPANSPYELLRQAAGMEVHEQGQGPGFASDASIRGFSSDHATDVALWVDGVPINEPVNGHAEGYNDWSVLFPAAIRDIDVLHGPTSALFGNFALAGIVNVRTLERLDGTEVSATGGSFGHSEATVLTGFDHGSRGGGVVGARYEREDGFRPNSRFDIAQGHARVLHELGSGVTIDAGAELYGSNWNSPGFLSESEFDQHDYSIVSNPTDGGYKRRAQERVSLSVLTGSFLWRSTVYSTQARWQLFLTIPPAGGKFEGSGSQTEEEDSRAGAGATTALTYPFERGEITLGAETRWDRSRYENYFTTARVRDSAAALVDARQILGAPFLQSHVDLTDQLRVDFGLRYDELATRSAPDTQSTSSDSHGVLSPKLGAVYRFTPAWSLFGNVSRGFRSPDGIILDPTLVPITLWAYETGVKFDAPRTTVSASVFRMDVSNEETFNPVTLATFSGGSSRRQGVELDWRAEAVPRTLTVHGDWTFNDARYRSLTAVPDDSGAAVSLNGLRVYNTSKYVGDVAVDLTRPRSAWTVRVSGNWVGPYSPFDEPGVVVGGYGLAHISAERSFGQSVLEIGVRNLFDRAYPELVAGHIVAPGQPRTAFATVRLRTK